MDFDNEVRAKFLGYNSSHTLYRMTSCDRVIPLLKVPFLVLQSMDDPITSSKDMPKDELLRN
jgi:predicted alpha/beta-fold hydrolase